MHTVWADSPIYSGYARIIGHRGPLSWGLEAIDKDMLVRRRFFYYGDSELAEQCQNTVEIDRAQQIPITFEMLAGEGQYHETAQQLNFNPAVYSQVNTEAKKAV